MSSCEVYNCLLSLFAEMPGKDWYLTNSLTDRHPKCGESDLSGAYFVFS